MVERAEPRSLFVDLGGSCRHVAEWGRRGAPVLLLQHGIRDHARNWDWVAARFLDTHHILAPDLRGHGDSDWSGDEAYALSDYVRDLADVADALNAGRFDLLGHSLGGHIALRYAAAFPERVRSLIVIEGIEMPIVRDQRREPAPYPARLRDWIISQRDRKARSARYYMTEEEAQARMAAQHPAIDAQTIAHLTRHSLIMESGKGLRWKHDNACRFRAPDDAHGIDLNDILDAIACPALLAYGDASWIPLPPAERLKRIENHRIVTFPGVSHWLHHQAREPFITAVSDFLSDQQDLQSEKRESHA